MRVKLLTRCNAFAQHMPVVHSLIFNVNMSMDKGGLIIIKNSV